MLRARARAEHLDRLLRVSSAGSGVGPLPGPDCGGLHELVSGLRMLAVPGPDPAFVSRLRDQLISEAGRHAEGLVPSAATRATRQEPPRPRWFRRPLLLLLVLALAESFCWMVQHSRRRDRRRARRAADRE